ncbi:MAG: hypothetical protein A2900_04065 [Candidatus Chisholmbacteria bacterium RIFCSPLOWO2_01_FULL_50_28]|uniref:UmuC domain-containing protein n=1 Tax=Candidatus Chisholmbacteria bacterium RIFCSPHIGHO2_01_FULL_52_32 TaxID=1797591 RepID=A0A1G1VST3_9BACT|nr:MAG: hypothetical protein A2786_02680 [Candidatus Chisholmbacteria bacterium RIFCSPHIGHO2_01_FULL_52_32]OGY20245.1 MAG: hypothetical protein A2900_04065 [Candidatus Chisholmbacteria bacterium RIFCSPLOWO2_01_FULL_50_28]
MTILHVDLNSYFATVEQQQNPFLRGKPVGIVKDIGRMCIIAASKEAKRLGIKTGTNLHDARKLAPRLILIKADFDKYLDYTKRFFALVESFSPDVTLFSLDEAFINTSNCIRLCGSAETLAVKIQEKIYAKLGNWVTASIGISYNRTLAKLAGDHAPKGGYFRISKENLDEILAGCKPRDICGIGPRLEEKLINTGVTNILQIRKLEDKILKLRFGPFWGPELKRISIGEESHLLRLLDSNLYMKGVGRTITGFRLCDSEEEIQKIIRNLVEEATYKIRQMNLAGRQISIFLEGEEKIWYRHRTLKYHVRHPDEVFDLIYNGLYKGWQRSFAVIRFGVHVGLLSPVTNLTACWLESWQKREKLWSAVDAINKKHGFASLRSARLLRGPLIRPEVTGYLGDKLYQFPRE